MRNASSIQSFPLTVPFISLSCSLPVFMAAVGVSFLGDNDIAIMNIIAFLVGAGGVLALVSTVAALAGTGVIKAIGNQHRLMRKIAGTLTAAAGAYVLLYWSRSLFGEAAWMRGILDIGGYWSSNFSMWLSCRMGPALVLFGIFVILAAAWLLWSSSRRRSVAVDE